MTGKETKFTPEQEDQINKTAGGITKKLFDSIGPELESFSKALTQQIIIEKTFKTIWPYVIKAKPRDYDRLSQTFQAPTRLGDIVEKVDITPRIGIDAEDIQFLEKLSPGITMTAEGQKGPLPIELWISDYDYPVMMHRHNSFSILFPKAYIARLKELEKTSFQAVLDDVEAALSPSTMSYFFNSGKPFQITHAKTKTRRRVKIGVQLNYPGAPVIDIDNGGKVGFPVTGSIIIKGIGPQSWADASLKRIQKLVNQEIEKGLETSVRNFTESAREHLGKVLDQQDIKETIQQLKASLSSESGTTGEYTPVVKVARNLLGAMVPFDAELMRFAKWKGIPIDIDHVKKGSLTSIARKQTLSSFRLTTFEDDALEAVMTLFDHTNRKGTPGLIPVQRPVGEGGEMILLPRMKITEAEYLRACGDPGAKGNNRIKRREALLSFNDKAGYMILSDIDPDTGAPFEIFITGHYFTVDGRERKYNNQYTITAGIMMMYKLDTWHHYFPERWTQELMEAEIAVTGRRGRKNIARNLVRRLVREYDNESAAKGGKMGDTYTIKRKWQRIATSIGITDNDVYINRNRGRDELTTAYRVAKRDGWITSFKVSGASPDGMDTITINCKKMTPQRALNQG